MSRDADTWIQSEDLDLVVQDASIIVVQPRRKEFEDCGLVILISDRELLKVIRRPENSSTKSGLRMFKVENAFHFHRLL